MAAKTVTEKKQPADVHIEYRQYKDEQQLPIVMCLIDEELSEPYSIFTYRYFLHNWPQLCWLAYDGDRCFGTVVSKMDTHRCTDIMRGYIAMLVVEKPYRSLGIGSELVKRTITAMIEGGCEEVALEAEVTNSGALALYQNLGFIRDKRLHKYYLNGADAYRLKLLLPLTAEQQAARNLAELGLMGDAANADSSEQTNDQHQRGESASVPC